MTYAEYRAQRLATVDEKRVPATWRMDMRTGLVSPNDRAARRRAQKRSDWMDRQELSKRVQAKLLMQLHWW